jgi:hypothetical protein
MVSGKIRMLISILHYLGIERLGVYHRLPNMALFVPVFPEILNRLLIFSKPIVTSIIRTLDNTQA